MSPAEFKRIREKLGLTQTDLAELLGLSGRNPITHYEMGFRRPSNLIVALMRIFEEWPEKKSLELREAIKKHVASTARKRKKDS